MLFTNTSADSRRFFSSIFAFFTVLLASSLVAIVALANNSDLSIQPLVVLSLAAHLFYGVALFSAARSKQGIITVLVVLLVSLVLRLIMLPAPPVFSDDIYRYVWDGRMLTSGVNPYSFAPLEVQASAFGDPIWKNINNPELRTIYPPFAQLMFASIAAVSPSVMAFKAASALADLGNVLLVILLAGGSLSIRNRPTENKTQRRANWAGLAYGLNPLCCIETSMSGHLDSFGVLAVLLTLLFLKRGRPISGAVFLALGTGIKILPVLLAPLLKGKRLIPLAVFIAILVSLYLPFVSVRESAFETFDTYARNWEGNAGIFALLKIGVTRVVGLIAGVSSASEIVHLKILDPIAAALQDTFFSLHKAGGFDPEHLGKFALGDLALAFSKVIVGIFILALIIVQIRRKIEPIKAAACILGAFLLVTPVLHPWYLIWILPLAAVKNSWPWFVFAALSTLAYLPLDSWWSSGIWVAPPWIQVVEYGGFAVAWAIFLGLKGKSGQLN